CSLFQRSVVRIPIPVASTFVNVAVRAVHAQGCGEETHCPHEFVHGNSPQHLDVLEGFFRHLRFLTRVGLSGLAACPRGPQEAQDHGCRGTTDRSPEFKIHFASLHLPCAKFAEPFCDPKHVKAYACSSGPSCGGVYPFETFLAGFGPPTLYACSFPHAMGGCTDSCTCGFAPVLRPPRHGRGVSY